MYNSSKMGCAWAFYNFDQYIIRTPLCLYGSHETLTLLVHQRSLRANELNFLHLIDFMSVLTTCIWLKNLSSVALE